MHYIAGVNESTIFMALLSKCVVFLYNNLSNKYHSMEEYVTDLTKETSIAQFLIQIRK